MKWSDQALRHQMMSLFVTLMWRVPNLMVRLVRTMVQKLTFYRLSFEVAQGVREKIIDFWG